MEQQNNDEALAYFYCSRNEAGRQNPTIVLSSFVRQLSVPHQKDSMQRPIVELYEEKKIKGFASGNLTHEESEGALLQLSENYPQITLVLDALDECDKSTRDQLMDTLETLISQSPNLVKIFIASRPDLDIKERFEGGPNLVIQAGDNRDDISKFVKDAISKSPRHWQKKVSSALKIEICEVLVDKSDGM